MIMMMVCMYIIHMPILVVMVSVVTVLRSDSILIRRLKIQIIFDRMFLFIMVLIYLI